MRSQQKQGEPEAWGAISRAIGKSRKNHPSGAKDAVRWQERLSEENKKIMKKKVKVWIAVAVVAVIIVSCNIVRFGKKEAQDTATTPVVTVTPPQRRSIELSSELIGTIEPDNIVYVKPKAGGDITGVYIKAGDRVEAGALLCTIDTKQLETARLSMEAARVSMNTAQDAWNRLQILYNSGDVSEQEYTQTKNSAQAAAIQYESAQEAYRIQSENANVTAPISGVVESCSVELHDSVGTSDQICVISGEGGRAVTFYVSDRVVKGVRSGDLVSVEKSGSTYPASVTEVSSMVDSATGLFEVKASVEDNGALPTGSSVKLEIISERAEDVLTIPVDAVYYEQGNPFVYTYESGIVHKNPVETGLYDSEYMEIRGGLDESAQVIETWTSELYEGSRVDLSGEGKSASRESESGGGEAPSRESEAGEQSGQSGPNDQSGQKNQDNQNNQDSQAGQSSQAGR